MELSDVVVSGYETRLSQLLTDGTVALKTAANTSAETSKFSQTFTPTTAYLLSAVELHLKKTGTPTGFCNVNIYVDNGGSPGGLLASSPMSLVSDISTASDGVSKTFQLISPVQLSSGVKYHAIFEYAPSASISGSNYISVFVKTSDVISGGNILTYPAGLWTNDTTKDALIRLFAKATAAAYASAVWAPTLGADIAPVAMLSKVGKQVTLVMPGFTVADGGSAAIEASVLIPAGFRPAADGGDLHIPVRVLVATVGAIAFVAIGTDGSLAIFSTAAGDGFPDATAVEIPGFSVSYIVD